MDHERIGATANGRPQKPKSLPALLRDDLLAQWVGIFGVVADAAGIASDSLRLRTSRGS